MRGWADDAGWVEILAASIALNIGTVAASIALWRLLVGRRAVGAATRQVGARDIRLAASTTLVNAIIVLPVWWLWRRGQIELADPSIGETFVGAAYLLVGLDLAMYVLHRTFHTGELYRWFHSWHHTDDERMTPLTLFVMHPAEAAGFGAVTAGLMWLYPVSVAGDRGVLHRQPDRRDGRPRTADFRIPVAWPESDGRVARRIGAPRRSPPASGHQLRVLHPGVGPAARHPSVTLGIRYQSSRASHHGAAMAASTSSRASSEWPLANTSTYGIAAAMPPTSGS